MKKPLQCLRHTFSRTWSRLMRVNFLVLHTSFHLITGPSVHPMTTSKMANMYIGSLIDFERSIMRHPDRWTTIQSQLDSGENVVLFANHQSEGDAAFIPLFTGNTSRARAKSDICGRRSCLAISSRNPSVWVKICYACTQRNT